MQEKLKLPHLGLQVQKARKDANIPIEELAKMCGVHYNHIRNIECGLKRPSHELLIKVCIATNKDPNFFFAPYLVVKKSADRLDILTASMDKRQRDKAANVLSAVYPKLAQRLRAVDGTDLPDESVVNVWEVREMELLEILDPDEDDLDD